MRTLHNWTVAGATLVLLAGSGCNIVFVPKTGLAPTPEPVPVLYERDDHRCGPDFDNAHCGPGRCCSSFGWCGSWGEVHCAEAHGWDGEFDGPWEEQP